MAEMMLECYHSSIHGSLDWLWPGFQQTGECYLFWCHFSILFIVFVPYWRSKYKICICITFTYHRNQTKNIKVPFPDVSILPSVVPQAVPCTPKANIRNCFYQFLGWATAVSKGWAFANWWLVKITDDFKAVWIQVTYERFYAWMCPD